ncbi:hypothetical protein JOB18_045593 [Solea senegalensis]|uniref:Uncharacterized protein n=1 Tax=Solea senegalensis TaxID=28829 RepID=A0AAV6SG58_SOLSE|nr:hypothetical protein JOB18_045593 [Solea senegalensis]
MLTSRGGFLSSSSSLLGSSPLPPPPPPPQIPPGGSKWSLLKDAQFFSTRSGISPPPVGVLFFFCDPSTVPLRGTRRDDPSGSGSVGLQPLIQTWTSLKLLLWSCVTQRQMWAWPQER